MTTSPDTSAAGNDMDQTAELRSLPESDPLPFQRGLAVLAPPRALARSEEPVDVEGDTLEQTMVAKSIGEEPALPFESRPPMSPYAATTAGRRLMFFDPQTGQRLPFPVWADTPGHDSNPPSKPPHR